MNRELFLASEAGDVDAVQRLHELNRHVLGDVTFQGDTALYIAARKGHLNLVEWFLGENPSLAEAQNRDDNTLLHEASKTGNTDLVKVLLRHKHTCSVCCNRFEETALMIASQYGHVGIVKLLFEARTLEDILEWDRSVREAAYRGYKDVVVAMLDKTPSLYPLEDNLILHAAVQGGHLEIIKAMLNHRSWRNDSMMKKDKYGRCTVHVV